MFETINDHLLIRDQEWVGSRGWPVGDCAREPECQDRRGRRAIGYDAGKTVNGRKRHALADADGRVLVLQAHPGLRHKNFPLWFIRVGLRRL